MTRTPRNLTTAKSAGVKRDDSSPYVLVPRSLVSRFDDLVTSTSRSPEIGGVIIGRHRGPHLELICITDPGPADLSRPRSFLKQDPSHESHARDAWQASGGTDTYVGEWHSHPLGMPNPSDVDMRSWTKVARATSRMAAFVIVAPEGWALFVVHPGNRYKVVRCARSEEGRTGEVYATALIYRELS